MNKRDFFKPLVDAVSLIDETKKTPLPESDLDTIHSSQIPEATDRDGLWKAFKERFKLVSGKTADSVDQLLPLLLEQSLKEGYLDPALNDKILPALTYAGIQAYTEIDTANIDEIRQAAAMGVLDGVTTNPSLVAREGVDFHTRMTEICAM